MCGYVEDGGVTILRIRQLLNFPQPAVSARRSLENLAAILNFSCKRLAMVSCHLMYSYVLNCQKIEYHDLFGVSN